MSTPTLNIAPDAIVVADATLRGKITIGPSTIVHPKAVFDAKEGEIILRSHNIVEETAFIENFKAQTTRANTETPASQRSQCDFLNLCPNTTWLTNTKNSVTDRYLTLNLQRVDYTIRKCCWVKTLVITAVIACHIFCFLSPLEYFILRYFINSACISGQFANF
ncbi:dynactin subunit 6 [Ditylenchus destructor]|uniref:Dynactin subunit 6 n=1 Tax=Ditylenchus destructor TaxID=166010 RepID=A0AAD4R7C1_9BILA|nr:dynactin subunit 6 [Ditylenchus destructor]